MPLFTRYRLLFLCLALPLLSQADEVVLQDGSRLHGTVVKIQDATLTLETTHIGKLSIPMSAVSGITTDSPHGLSLDTTTPQKGLLHYDGTQQHFRLQDTPTTQPLEIASLQLLWPADETMPKPARLWTGRIQLGVSGADGNSDRFSFLGLTDATRKREQDTLLLYFQGAYAEDSGIRSRNEFKLGGRYEWNLTDKWSAYFRNEFEEDEFESLDLRTTTVLGMSHKLLGSPKQTLSTRFGIGYLSESFEAAEAQEDAILDLGYDYTLKVRDWTKFTHKLTYYSALDEPTENFRVVANTAAEIPLSNTQAWKLRVGLSHEYDDAPLPGIQNLDTTYYTNLTYNW